ncbi:MAG: prepilin-type N-terminal cleavage/methylation domain-containing protein [Fimbriimonadaceae bacterium]
MKKAFTLIELLVVIAIIAILAAILFPVFAQAKQAAKGTQSISNIRQTATASLIYSTDYDDLFVSQYTGPENGYGWQQSWIMLMLPYMKNYQILKDPNDSVKTTSNFDSGPKISYVANGIISGDCAASWGGWKFRGVINLNQGSGNWYEDGTRSQTQIPRIAQTVLFATRSRNPINAQHSPELNAFEGAFGAYNTILNNASTIDCDPSGGCTLPGQASLWSAPVPSYKGYIDRFYGNGSPVAFTDGHAKMMRPEQTVDFAAGTAAGNSGGCLQSKFMNMWDALLEN